MAVVAVADQAARVVRGLPRQQAKREAKGEQAVRAEPVAPRAPRRRTAVSGEREASAVRVESAAPGWPRRHPRKQVAAVVTGVRAVLVAAEAPAEQVARPLSTATAVPAAGAERRASPVREVPVLRARLTQA